MEIVKNLWGRPGPRETVVLLLGMLAVDGFLLEGNRFESVSPHPFWVVVLLMAVQYGTAEALFASALAALALRAGNLPQPGLDAYDWLTRAASLPLQWAVAAAVLGELRRAHRNREQRVRSELEQSETARAALKSAAERSERIRLRLEEREAANLRSISALYEAARKLEHPDPLGVLAGARDLVAAAMRASQFSIHLADGTRLAAVVRHGWSQDTAYPTRTGADSPLFHRVMLGRETLSVTDPAAAAVLEGEGLLAAPMVESDSGLVVGMLKIEQMEFTSLNQAALASLEVLCRWIADAFVKAQRFQDGRASAAFNASTRVLSYEMFEQQSLYLTRLARRMGFPLSAVTARLEDPASLTGAQRLEAEAALARSVRGHLRATDLAFEGGPEASYTVLLPATPLGGAWEVARHLLDSASEYSRRRFRFEAISLHDPDASRDDGASGQLAHLEDALERSEPRRASSHA